MTELDIRLFYRRMMVNIVMKWLETEFVCSSLLADELYITEFGDVRSPYVRVEFSFVGCSERPEHLHEHIRLEGYADIDHYGTVNEDEVSETYLVDVREVLVNE